VVILQTLSDSSVNTPQTVAFNRMFSYAVPALHKVPVFIEIARNKATLE
jgi:hypothetical protein